MSAATVDVRFGAVRQRSSGPSFANRIGVAHGSLPPATVIFEQKNRRRLHLIEKELARGLTVGEADELEKLQRETAGIMEYLHPLPTNMLDDLEALARRLEFQANQEN